MIDEPTAGARIEEVFGDEIIHQTAPIRDYAFGATPSASFSTVEHDRATAEHLAYAGDSRTFVASVAGRPQAAAVSIGMTQNIRGKIVPMAGVGSVASLPSGRRQGHVRQLFDRLLAGMHADSQIVSTFYPFRESFYERFGYVSLPAPRFAIFDPAALAPILKVSKPGSIIQLPMAEGWPVWRDVLETWQHGHGHGHHGFALRDRSYDVRNQEESTSWVAIARDAAGLPIGAMTFRITGYTKRLECSAFLASNALGKYLLLDWIGRHADQVSSVRIHIAPDERAENWLHDLRATVSNVDGSYWPGPSGRVVSVEGLSGIGAGLENHEIAIRVTDRQAPWNDGTFTLASEHGILVVTPGGSASCTLAIQGLSALVFSGHDPAEFVFRGWGDPDERAQATLRALFPRITPFLHEEF